MMKKSGLADSPFAKLMFEEGERASSPTPLTYAPRPSIEAAVTPVDKSPIKYEARQTAKPATKQPRHHATVIPRYHATMIGSIRAAVKIFGKEAATHRFTLEEKNTIRDIVYGYERQGLRTNENEISRIGVNFLMEDYRENGENSLLHKVLKALHS